jgi:hypothetical protein
VKPSHRITVGVAHATDGTRDTERKIHALSSDNDKFGKFRKTTAAGDWKDGDIIRVILDCDNHKLEVKNMRTGRGESWDNLPDDGHPWHLYASLQNNGDQATVLSATLNVHPDRKRKYS